MPRKDYNKLIRDLIPQRMEKSGATYSVKELNEDEYLSALKAKLLEEAQEFQTAQTPDTILNELADVFEVMRYLQRAYNISEEQLHAAAQAKLDKVGGFEKRLWLDWTDDGQA